MELDSFLMMWNLKRIKFNIEFYYLDIEEEQFAMNVMEQELRKETQYVKVNDKNIGQTLMMTISELYDWMKTFSFSEHDQKIASRILLEINKSIAIYDRCWVRIFIVE